MVPRAVLHTSLVSFDGCFRPILVPLEKAYNKVSEDLPVFGSRSREAELKILTEMAEYMDSGFLLYALFLEG